MYTHTHIYIYIYVCVYVYIYIHITIIYYNNYSYSYNHNCIHYISIINYILIYVHIHTCLILAQNAYERCRTPETPRICFSDHFSFPLGSPASLEGLSEFKLSDLTDLLLVQRLEDLDSAPKKGFDEDLSI